MNVALFEDAGWRALLPLTWLRPAWELRCGRDRLIDKIEAGFGGRAARFLARTMLHDVWGAAAGARPIAGDAWLLVNGRALVTAALSPPAPGVAWTSGDTLVAATITGAQLLALADDALIDPAGQRNLLTSLRQEPPPAGVRLIGHPWEPVLANADELRRQCRDGGQHAGRVDAGAHLLNPSAIHVAPGARIMPGVVLDAEHGPIHIDRDALVQPNAVVEGPCHVGPRSIIRPGAVLRAGTTIGPVCKVGGEIESSIIHGCSNKQHDGFLGHSYVGEWVNLGADTVTSDLKNTYGTIRVFINGVGVESGQRFVGSIIGDHAKTGIGTILPTGCVLGVASNVFTRGPVPKFVPSFAWLTDAGLQEYRVDKAIDVARTVMGRRQVTLTTAGEALLRSAAAAALDVESAGWKSP
jgi:UDP-N-acetylglucosamine diphosphorylase/glucosamine-1-phosphate N-acetyltransferase